MQAKDLRTAPPRRWTEELGGIRWLPRLVDKTRAAVAGTLGDYLYGHSPMDRSLLRALGLSYKEFTAIVRADDDDERVLQSLEKRAPDGLARARAWSERLPRRHRLFLCLIDLDDGYAKGPLKGVRWLIQLSANLISRYVRYRWPVRRQLVGLEIEAERIGRRAEEACGTNEEPYRWLTAQNLDFSWKLLLSIVLIFLILTYVLSFLQRIGLIALVIVAAIFFAYLIYPAVRWLNRRLPLLAAILLVYAVIVGLVVAGLWYLIPAISSQASTLVHEWPRLYAKIENFVNDPNNKLLANAPAFVRSELVRLPGDVLLWTQTHGAKALGNAVQVVLGTAAFVGALIVVPVLAAYLLYDSETIKRFFVGFIPERRRESTLDLLGELEAVIGGFIRGQLLVGGTIGLLIAIGLSLVHEPYAILIGAIAGALDLIPYIGPVIAAIPALTIAFATGGLRETGLVALVFIVANQAEGHVIAPNILKRTLKLTPSAIVIAILIGGELYGIAGMFVAVPIAGVIRVLLLHVIPGSVSRDEAKPVLTKDPQERAEPPEGAVGEASG